MGGRAQSSRRGAEWSSEADPSRLCGGLGALRVERVRTCSFFATRKESSLVDCGFTRAYVCACCLRHSSSVLLRACHFHSQDPIPDLVSMIRRIQQLETTMTHLQRACKEIAAKRKVVLPLAYEQISDNQVLLSQVRNGIV